MTQKEFMLVYRYLSSIVPDLPSHVILELHTINEELRAWNKVNQSDGVDTTDWDGYARQINQLLEEAGVDPIYTFVEVLEGPNN